jgi:hypothetical protein
LITFAGIPPTIAYGGISFVTTEPAPTTAHVQIVTQERIIAFLPIQTSFQIFIDAHRSFVGPKKIVQYSGG